MYRMIIADDEMLVRNGLSKIINWKEFNIEIIAVAEDGEVALELCRSLRPDILLTDIKMPFYSGIEVSEKLKEENIPTKIILISGYEDFNYAKSAIALKLENYILKPVKIEELKSTIMTVVEKLDGQKRTASSCQEISKDVLKEDFIRSLVLGIYSNEKKILDALEEFKLPIGQDKRLVVSLLQIDNYQDKLTQSFVKGSELMSFAVTNIANDILKQHDMGYCCYYDLQRYIILHKGCSFVNCLFKNIISSVNRYLNIDCTIGCGEPEELMRLYQSFKAASNALTYSFYKGHNCVITTKDMVGPSVKSHSTINLMELENSLMDSMRHGEKDNIVEAIDSIFDFVQEHSHFPIDYLKNICLQLLYSCIKLFSSAKPELEIQELSIYTVMNKIKDCSRLDELKKYVTSVLFIVSQAVSEDNSPHHKYIVKKIKDYIDVGYMKDISINDISEEICLTPNYLSLIFKRETGLTIGDYITEVRIGRAKDLLKVSDLKILEIAEKVGYKNAHYFSTLFKKIVGIHPKKYKTNAEKP
jgi:two-component system, response regulator YesN